MSENDKSDTAFNYDQRKTTEQQRTNSTNSSATQKLLCKI